MFNLCILTLSNSTQRTVKINFKARTKFEVNLQKGEEVMAEEFDETFSLVSNENKCGFVPSVYLNKKFVSYL